MAAPLRSSGGFLGHCLSISSRSFAGFPQGSQPADAVFESGPSWTCLTCPECEERSYLRMLSLNCGTETKSSALTSLKHEIKLDE